MKPDSTNSRAAEITAALTPAYTNASRLKIAKAEAKKLTKPFPEKDVEIRSTDGAIFIPHIFLSQRLNEVFGPGAWSLICREHYFEEDSQMLYAEHILIIRGCFVGEAVGEHKFNPLNGEKYGDALESSAAEALRRICGKRLSCGNQLWQPVFCQTWQNKFAETFQADVYEHGENRKVLRWRKKGSIGTVEELSETPLPASVKYTATEDDRHVMLQCLSILGNPNVLRWAISQNILKVNQTLDDWPLEQVALGERAVRALQTKIEADITPQKTRTGKWQDCEIPFGGMKGQKLGTLKPDDIAGYWTGMEGVKKTFHPDFVQALNAAAKHLNLTKLKTHRKK